MTSIESKYYDYCKSESILCARPKKGRHQIKPIYMNTNTIIKVTLSIISIGAVAFAATTHHAADYLPAMTEGVSYFAVVLLIAVAAIDYRTNTPKSVTGR